MDANRFNAVLGARSSLAVSRAYAPESEFANGSKAEAHGLALEGLPLDRSQA